MHFGHHKLDWCFNHAGTSGHITPTLPGLDDLAGHMDLDQFALASLSEDHKEGVAAFLERRKPKFRGQ